MSLPDGPKSPDIWQMLQWITMPFSFMRGCSRRYGDRFTANAQPENRLPSSFSAIPKPCRSF